MKVIFSLIEILKAGKDLLAASSDLRKRKPKPEFLECDFEDCEESAQWFRWWKGKLLLLCTKHEAGMGRRRLGKLVDPKELSNYDWAYLKRRI